MDKYLYYKENDYELYKGAMQDVLSTFEKNSIDSIVCDPPYELNFMNKGWDNSGVAFQPDTWKHCYDVLKEGGYLLAFGGSRTFHRIAVAIEDAGFEIRDTIMWLYGSGFPKSMALDKAIESKLVNGNANKNQFHKLDGVQQEKHHYGFTTKNKEMGFRPKDYTYEGESNSYLKELEATTDLAKQYKGWGTCLKPAYEPIIVARKPFKGSLVDNVIKNGVGGLNIDECRVAFVGNENTLRPLGKSCYQKGNKIVNSGEITGTHELYSEIGGNADKGRFPANVILTYDETDFDEVCGGMPDTKSTTTTMPNLSDKNAETGIYSKLNAERIEHLGGFNDSGSAARYFYCAKASKKDRDEGLVLFESKQLYYDDRRGNSFDIFVKRDENGKPLNAQRKNIHPTVKPVDLMQYLVRLVTPKNGTILDCFMGSGSTGKAVMFENRERNANYKFIGVEMTEEYLPICQSRIDYAKNKYEYELIKEKQEQQEKGIIDIFDFME